MGSTRDTTETGRNVLALGKAAIKALSEGAPEALEELERYSDSFEAWQASWKGQAAGRASFSSKEAEIGRRIAEQHATVLELTQQMKEAVEQSLRSLRGRSKGIRAYIDHLPKQIGTMRPRKG